MRVVCFQSVFHRLAQAFSSQLAGLELEIAPLEELQAAPEGIGVLIVTPTVIGPELLDSMPDLQLIQQWGAGIEGIDLEACTERGIAVCNVPSRGTGNAESVAELALLHTLQLARRAADARERFFQGRLHSPTGRMLRGEWACVVGLGGLGRTMVECFRGIGMRVCGVNRTCREGFDELGLDAYYPLEGLRQAVRGSLVVAPALPLRGETRGIIDGSVLAAMERGSFLVNVARGGLVDREALEAALDGGHLGGVGLDVFWEEPPDPGDPLFTHRNVVVTPHVGGVTREAQRGIAAFVGDNLRGVLGGETPQGCRNC
ncbi:MAG: glyoxylate reductase [Synergistales bacterium]|nr:glyoxylate reductase [Synergistales bacterium]